MDNFDDFGADLSFDKAVKIISDTSLKVMDAVLSLAFRPDLRYLPCNQVILRLKMELFDFEPDWENPDMWSVADPETPVREMLAGGEVNDILNELGNQELDSTKRLSQYGEQQAPVDQIADALLTFGIHLYLGDKICAVGGEEKKPDEWASFRRAVAGGIVVIVDPVDGTTNFRDLRSSFSVNVLIYRATGDGLHGELLAAIVTICTGDQLICSLNPDKVTIRSRAGAELLVGGIDTIPNDKSRLGTVAVVAARGPARAALAELFDAHGSFDLPARRYGGNVDYDPALTIYTVGGAPAMVAFLLGDLEYVVVPNDQTVYDAAPVVGVLLAAGEGATYIDARTGEQVGVNEMCGWMSNIGGPFTSNPRPFKAGVLVRGGSKETTTAIIVAAVRKSLLPAADTDRVVQPLRNALVKIGVSIEDVDHADWMIRKLILSVIKRPWKIKE